MSNTKRFPVDTEVTVKGETALRGKVVDHDCDYDGYVNVLWDNGTDEEVHVGDLIRVADLDLDQDFEAFRAEVNAKLAEAIDKLKAAKNLARTRDFSLEDPHPTKYETLFNFNSLKYELNEFAAWNSSRC